MLELFHTINHPPSAVVRRRIDQLGLLPRIRYRNIYFSEAQADFESHGGRVLPALWDGDTLIEGEAEVLAALEKL